MAHVIIVYIYIVCDCCRKSNVISEFCAVGVLHVSIKPCGHIMCGHYRFFCYFLCITFAYKLFEYPTVIRQHHMEIKMEIKMAAL